MLALSTKLCRVCKLDKPVSSFYKNLREIDGLSRTCKTCSNLQTNKSRKAHPERVREQDRLYRALRPLAMKAAHLKSLYGITLEQYTTLLNLQGGVCGVCGTENPGCGSNYFCVDHDHGCCSGRKSCGKCIRGLLCHACNRLLGNSKDQVDVLAKAVSYLNKAKAPKGDSRDCLS